MFKLLIGAWSMELYELQEIDHEAAKLKWSMMKRQATEQEVKKLRREIEEQEILIRGYQVESGTCK
jgi:hypothetical protein